jgi:histidinol-phosphate phosphatase family protein
MSRAVFLDRDGTIVPDEPYLDDAGKLELYPGAAKAIARLRNAGFKVVIVTNQSGVGRGLFSEEKLREINERLKAMLREEGAEFDALYYCPHRPDDGCPCRKPATGMIDRASEAMSISLGDSYVVGDDIVDVELARKAGAKSVLVLTGHGMETRSVAKPDMVTEGLAQAVDWILRDSGGDE